MCSELVEARIEATAGLQMSQPVPVPYRSISPEKVRRPLAWTISNSSVRDWEKCSHNAFETSTPSAVSNCDSRGTHDPQEVPAAVQPFRSATVQAPSAMAEHNCALVTLLHEQICASSGNAPTPIAGP